MEAHIADPIMNYVFESADAETIERLESDPRTLQATMKELIGDLTEQALTFRAQYRQGRYTFQELETRLRRANSVRTRLQGKMAHVKNLVHQAAQDEWREQHSHRHLVRAIQAHQAASNAAGVEPEQWDLDLWATAAPFTSQ